MRYREGEMRNIKGNTKKMWFCNPATPMVAQVLVDYECENKEGMASHTITIGLGKMHQDKRHFCS